MSDPLTKDIETGETEALQNAGVNLPPEPELKGPLKPVAETTLKEQIAGGIAGIASITAILAIILEFGYVVLFAGLFSIGMGCYAYVQQTKLTDIITLQETTAAVQVEVDRLRTENERLANNVNELATTIDDLQDVEQALEVVSATSNQSIVAFEEQIEENRQILTKMRHSTKGRIVQNLISILYRGDTNADDIISEEEVDDVLTGLQQVANVTVHEDRLKAAIVGQSIDAIVDVCKNLLSDEGVPDEERIFDIEE